MSKSQKYLSIRLKIADKSVDLFVLNGILCKVRTYTITVSFRRSSQTRYQKSNILVSDRV